MGPSWINTCWWAGIPEVLGRRKCLAIDPPKHLKTNSEALGTADIRPIINIIYLASSLPEKKQANGLWFGKWFQQKHSLFLGNVFIRKEYPINGRAFAKVKKGSETLKSPSLSSNTLHEQYQDASTWKLLSLGIRETSKHQYVTWYSLGSKAGVLPANSLLIRTQQEGAFSPTCIRCCNFTLFSSFKRDFFFLPNFLSFRANKHTYKIYNTKIHPLKNCLLGETRGIRRLSASFILQGAKRCWPGRSWVMFTALRCQPRSWSYAEGIAGSSGVTPDQAGSAVPPAPVRLTEVAFSKRQSKSRLERWGIAQAPC